MSHVAKLEVKFTNLEAIQRACERVGGRFLGKGIEKFYDETEVGGYLIHFPDWQYNLVITAEGNLIYDNYEGEWGNQAYLDKFKQLYAVETAKIAAEANQYYYQEETLPTGVLKLTIEV